MTTITIRNGTEGPHYDPYAFQEITVTRPTREVTIHMGLANWAEADDGSRMEGETDARAFFTFLAGVTPEQATKAAEEFQARRIRYHRCGAKHLQWVHGFPGETLLHCNQCGDIIDSHFNRREIE